MAAHRLRTADITGLTFDLENPCAVLAETPSVSYLGYAIKE
jgi:hypothetical protein